MEMKQISMFPNMQMAVDTKSKEDANKKRRWENAFQRWSNDSFINDDTTSYGACGYGSMCEWCESNDYGRPCVRALNAMFREKGIRIDYDDRDFEKIWEMKT